MSMRLLPTGHSQVVRSGHSAIVDAVHARPADRQAIERLAGASVPFIGLWLDAPKALLIERTNRRRSRSVGCG